jgi:hypothetical protein
LQLFEQLLKQLIHQFHKVPVAVVDNVEVSQLFTTFTTGAVGVVLERQRLNLVNLYIHLHFVVTV